MKNLYSFFFGSPHQRIFADAPEESVGLRKNFPLTGHAANIVSGSVWGKLALPFLPPAFVADSAYNLAGTALDLGQKYKVIDNTISFTKSAFGKVLGWGGTVAKRGASFIYDGTVDAAVKPIFTATLDTSVAAAHGLAHAPKDIYNIGMGTFKSVAGLLMGVPGIFSKKASGVSQSMLKGAFAHFGDLHMPAAIGSAATSIKNSAIHSAEAYAKLYPNLLLGQGNFISNAAHATAEKVAGANILERIFGTRDAVNKTLGGALYPQAA